LLQIISNHMNCTLNRFRRNLPIRSPHRDAVHSAKTG
jgi:hypothetical protein